MDNTVKLPVGIDNFEKLRTEGFYYIDKTGLITELLHNWSEIHLFTRPRRFGKSLNMSMLKCFFEYGCDSRLFEGLDIARETELCDIIGNEAMRFQFLSESGQLTENERGRYRQLIAVGGNGEAAYVMTDDVLAESLRTLCQCLYKHYGQKAVLLIDEYDVPLDKARHFGYCDDMVKLIRNLYSRALKSNDFRQFAVMTGCLKIVRRTAGCWCWGNTRAP